jgi:AcrR family transcriptional regulator
LATDRQPTRADARRNRERLLAVASATFAAADAPVSLDGIARGAGVGIGTLYRHFPTREALVEAVYAAELDAVTAAAAELADTLPAADALRAWTERYAAFIATKRGMSDTLRTSASAGRVLTPTTRERITTSIGQILAAGARDGTLREHARPDDVTALLLGVFLASPPGTEPDRTGRLLDLVVDALRP